MKSIREIYKTGKGPSSSHTMGPERAANYFKNAHPQADGFRVILYGSLSKTGVGHGTDRVLREVLAPVPTEIVFSDEALPASAHPNTMDLIALKNGAEADRLRVESIGGGDIRIPGQTDSESEEVYVEHSFAEIADFCKWRYIQTLSDYVEQEPGRRSQSESACRFLPTTEKPARIRDYDCTGRRRWMESGSGRKQTDNSETLT